MLGRKIIEVFPDENIPDATEAASKDAPGLTPDTTHTFGLPNPTSIEEASDSGPSISSDVTNTSTHEKRHRRYSQQEVALKSTLQHTTREPSRRDLQIRALERATALLSQHAKEAQDRANKLRSALTQRDVDPETFRTLQRERWMEERRSNARTEEAKALKQLMLRITGPDHAPGTQRTQSLPTGAADVAKRQANLLSFSEKSPTKLFFTRRRGAKQHPQALHHSLTLSETRPMRLRTSAPVPALSKPTKVNRTRNSPLERGRPAASSSPISLATTPMSVVELKVKQQPRTREQIDSDMSDVGLPSYALDLLGGFDDIRGEITLSSSAPASKPVPIPPKSKKRWSRAQHPPPPESYPTPSISFPSQHSTPSSSPARSTFLGTPPKHAPFSAIRRPLSFMGHKTSDSVATAGPGSSVRMSGDGVVLAERPSTPVGSMNSMEKRRWGGSTSSPAKALSKMKNRLSMMGGKR
ncbi:hypothetical protein EIP91_004598 [Steccherinum ochraceum]|uniref:Uncharacterized protein n=1 Tax=Steccherinum ochraceum TaxID=92696 RepID=A0A4R0RH05_9APHY|nr:hypothetical protein EIP91_004598 [Steccherinum ochraceum]